MAWLLTAGLLLASVAAVLAITALLRERRLRTRADTERIATARELDRRLNELFSLRELSYGLSASLQLDRVTREVARYALRFLQAQGAMVLLADPDAGGLRVSAAEGTLAQAAGRVLPADEDSLPVRAVGLEHLQLSEEGSGPVDLGGGLTASNAAIVPLRAHGVTLGALVVADRHDHGFTPEDLWLVSTAATQVAVVIANSRFFELIREGRDAWEATFDALSAGVALLDGTGRVRRSNRALGRMLDRPEATLVGKQLAGLLVDPGHPAEAFVDLASRGGNPPTLVTRAEALSRTLRLTAAPLPRGSEAGAAVVLIEDVTEQRRMEQQLIQADKMAAVGQLVSGVAHELNNPLASIAGLAEFLVERAPEDHPDTGHLRVIHEQAERAGRIVRNLLTFARQGAAEQVVMELNEVAQHAAQLVAYEFRLRGVMLEAAMAPGPLAVQGDPHELQQVVLNLLTNAAWAVSEDAGHAGDRRVRIRTGFDGPDAIVEVTDTGAGVPDDLVPSLFTPFVTTKPPGKGTGLGLSISYGIMEAHGGRLTYGPAPGGGACFTARLPRLREPVPAGPGYRVLVADADPTTLRVIAAVLSAEGATVQSASTADEALALAARDPADLAILDPELRLPSGVRLLEALRRELPTPPRRFLLLALPGEAGGDELPILHKPVAPREVREALRAHRVPSRPGPGAA